MDILDLRDRISALPTLQSRMSQLQKALQTAEDELRGLLRRYERESRDVERIRNNSFSGFLYKLIGKYVEKLDKEQREEIDAKLAYDRAAAHLDALTREKDKLAARIAELRAEEKAYQAELTNRRRELVSRLTEPEGERYAGLESERKAIISQITEIREALSAASRVRLTAESALESLSSAQKWATYDVIADGGIFSHMAKYEHIDDAERCFHSLSSQLRKLKTELGDVHGLTAYGLTEISGAQRAVDFWFDNIFTDLSVRSQIKDNAAQIRGLLSNLSRVEFSLKSRMREEEAKLAKNRQCEEELLLSI